eukprot:CAMPEP_0172477382 /NCGR_PEP_ID=MMETSP1066-20121228/471_1 /TAXON_ID=671091 /ORGANISM="Coscinodiscus wailesii, Strain CCMP2513" /LENGTH=210 /DNA_ID=CAMNT_0013235821 /DNA_START=84 /DNA_END=712 /DNA_ORIENTATION=-
MFSQGIKLVLACALLQDARAFTPANLAFSQTRALTTTSPTSLDLFGLRRRKKSLEVIESKEANGSVAPPRANGKIRDLKKKSISEEEVRSLFSLWNNALATGDSRIVASRYASECCLLPTVSDTPRTDFDSVKDYFDAFLLKKPQGKIIEGYIKIGDGWASDTGIYEFTMGIDGSKVRGRYSYVYTYEDGAWKIYHHHSSVLPEGIALGA